MHSCTIMGDRLPPLELSIAKDKIRQFVYSGITHFYLFFGDKMTRQLLPYILKLKSAYPNLQIFLCYSSTPLTERTKCFLSKFKKVLPHLQDMPLGIRAHIAYDFVTKNAEFAYIYLKNSLSPVLEYYRYLRQNKCQFLRLQIPFRMEL